MKRALVISLICVIGFAFSGLAATLSGSWDTDITILPQQTNFNDALSLVSVLEVTYTVGDWAFKSTTSLTEDGWAGQTFGLGTGAMLGAFSLTSLITFDPAGVSFTSWSTTAGVNMMGVSFDVTFLLVPENVDLDITIGGSAGDVVFEAIVSFGDPVGTDCDLDWAGIAIGVDFPFGECATILSTLTFTCDGFGSVVFAVDDFTIPYIEWLVFDASITFTETAKTVVLTPGIVDFGFDCIDLTIALDSTPGGNGVVSLIEGLNITAMGLTVVFGDATFTGITYFGTPPTKYFEIYTISYTGLDCCDGAFTFDAGFYFVDGGATLFDLGLIDVDITVGMAEAFVFNMGLQIDLEGAGFNEWLIGFLVTW